MVAMLQTIEVPPGFQLADYERYAGLGGEVASVRKAGRAAARRLEGRTVWMVNSTAQGGGVAEMLYRQVPLMRQVGLDVRWLVISAEDPAFFRLTKRLHNMIHGVDEGPLTADDKALYERTSQAFAQGLKELVRPKDLLVVHDPQPLGAGALVGCEAIWRCHIGLDRETEATRAAWAFLRPWLGAYGRKIFSLEEYVPAGIHADVIHPAIDPLSHKNRELAVQKLTGILTCAGLVRHQHPLVAQPFASPVLRLQADGKFGVDPEDFGLLFRPTVVQVSRWDKLKGFGPLLDAFALLRADGMHPATRLVLAGPDPASIQDDPEAIAELKSLSARWLALPPGLQADVAILSLPMASLKENHLVVNALQRCGTVVVQNSVQEGFGLTATEAMWKSRPVLATKAAGLRAQVRDRSEGRLIDSAADVPALAQTLQEMLSNGKARELWGANAHFRVATHFTVLHALTSWLELLAHARASAA
jgi:trehalose synthase